MYTFALLASNVLWAVVAAVLWRRQIGKSRGRQQAEHPDEADAAQVVRPPSQEENIAPSPEDSADSSDSTTGLRSCLRKPGAPARVIPSRNSGMFHLAPRPPGAECKVAAKAQELRQWHRRYERCKEELQAAKAGLADLAERAEDGDEPTPIRKLRLATAKMKQQESQLHDLRTRFTKTSRRQEDILDQLRHRRKVTEAAQSALRRAEQQRVEAESDADLKTAAACSASAARDEAATELRSLSQARTELSCENRLLEKRAADAQRETRTLQQKLRRIPCGGARFRGNGPARAGTTNSHSGTYR